MSSKKKTRKVNDGGGAATGTSVSTRKRKVREKDGGAAAANWMDIPPELLQLVARKLTNICDYIRFRGVCAKWRSSAADDTGGQHRWLPCLFFSPREDGDTLPIFNPADRRFYSLSLPEEAQGKTIRGSAHGWLAMLDSPYKPGGVELSLYNPFTRACIVLPNAPTHIFRVVMCCNPSTASPRQLLASVLQFKRVLIYRQGDDSYAKIKTPPGFSGFLDIIYHEEKAALYAVCRDGMLAVLDLASSTMRPLIDTPLPKINSFGRHVRLVLAAGDLLLLVWDSVRIHPLENFVVFKLDRSKEGRCFKWVRATTIGDSTILFASRIHSVSVDVVCDRDFPDGRANQIYHFRDYNVFPMNGYYDITADIEVRDFNSNRKQPRFITSAGRVRGMMHMKSLWMAWMVPVLN